MSRMEMVGSRRERERGEGEGEEESVCMKGSNKGEGVECPGPIASLNVAPGAGIAQP